MPFGLALLVALLAGCSSRDVGNEWFPLREGDSQTLDVRYETDEAREPEQWVMRVDKPTVFQDQPVGVRHHSAGVSYYLKTDDQGVRRIATRADIDEDPAADSEPVWVLKAPYVVGTEWSTVTVPYLLQRKNEYPRDLKYSHKTLMTWRIEAVDEAVTLSDGTEHQPCLRVVGQALLNLYTDPVRGFTDLPLVSREWYCKGEGLVKFEREELVPPGYFTGGKLLAEQQR
ncbi:MAG: hypothetical protein KDF54_03790 [Hydrogenophaga sp.]|nr:hypothetical protein [Hydrogenophaga sp.]